MFSRVKQVKFAAVIWDFGGVFTTSPFAAFNRYERARGIPNDFIRGVNAVNPTSNAWAKFESSTISLAEFDRAFAQESAAAGYEIPGREVIALLAGDLRPRMVAALAAVKSKYRVACITNNVKAGEGPSIAGSRAQAAQIAAVMAMFDLVLESSQIGIRKPDRRIYAMACERLGILPQEAVYLDDLGINLKPARELGMTTIKVVSEQQALAALHEVLGMSL